MGACADNSLHVALPYADAREGTISLYFAAMKRCPGDVETTNETLDRMTAKIVSLGKLPARWTHTLDKDKQGNNKLLPLKMNYDKSKQIFAFNALPGLYELIDIGVPPHPNPDENAKWRAFIVSYLSCMELLTLILQHPTLVLYSTC